MSLENLKSKALEYSKKAVEADQNKSLKTAHKFYKKAIKTYLIIRTRKSNIEETDSILKHSFEQRISEYLDRAENISEYLNSQFVPEGPVLNPDSPPSTSNQDRFSLKTPPAKSKTWEDIIGLSKTRLLLKESILLPFQFPHFFSEKKTEIWKGVLLYGPPGNGKSLLARACETECSFYEYKPEDLDPSGSEIRSLFEKGRATPPAIIFFDKIDLFCSSKEPIIKNELLTEMTQKNKDLVVLAATDSPWTIHPEVLQIFDRKIYVPLPEKKARAEFWKEETSNSGVGLTDLQIETLSELTEGCSSLDIKLIIKSALSSKKLENYQLKKDLTNSEKSSANLSENHSTDLPLKAFIKAVHRSKPSVTINDLIKYREFSEKITIQEV